MKANHVSVCICTFRRPRLLQRLLEALERQAVQGFDFSIVVADNDAEKSAEETVGAFARRSAIQTAYCHEPRQNIALARNKVIEHAVGDFIAFIDDDEFPAPDWLARLYQACLHFQAAGVLGPVRPHFDQPPPTWIVRGRFCERPEHPTGTVMAWAESRTGNLLFRREILRGVAEPFNPEFGTAGEDMNFFWRMTAKGHVFVWCNEAVAFEVVPASRLRRTFMIKRAFLRGGNSPRHPEGRFVLFAKSVLAVPAYTLMLPFLPLAGHHHFMKYLVKSCDHLGRLLSLLGFRLVQRREM